VSTHLSLQMLYKTLQNKLRRIAHTRPHTYPEIIQNTAKSTIKKRQKERFKTICLRCEPPSTRGGLTRTYIIYICLEMFTLIFDQTKSKPNAPRIQRRQKLGDTCNTNSAIDRTFTSENKPANTVVETALRYNAQQFYNLHTRARNETRH